MNSRTFSVRYDGLNIAWRGYFDVAEARWGNAGLGVTISTIQAGNRIIQAGDFPGSWFGFYKPAGIATSRTFLLRVNIPNLTKATSSAAQLASWAKSTATHELGHALRLSDNPTDPNPNYKNKSLMNHGRDRDVVGSPTSYDKDYVKACYR